MIYLAGAVSSAQADGNFISNLSSHRQPKIMELPILLIKIIIIEYFRPVIFFGQRITKGNSPFSITCHDPHKFGIKGCSFVAGQLVVIIVIVFGKA